MKLIFSPLLPLALPLAPYPVPWIEPDTKEESRSMQDQAPRDRRTDKFHIERCSKTLN